MLRFDGDLPAVLFDNLALEVGGDGDDACGAVEYLAIPFTTERGEERWLAHAFITDKLVDFDDVGNSVLLSQATSGVEEEGMAFVDEAVIFLTEAIADAALGLEVIGDFGEFEERAGEVSCY